MALLSLAQQFSDKMNHVDLHSEDLRALAEYHVTTPIESAALEKLSLRQKKFLSEVKLPLDVVIGSFEASVEALIDLTPGATFEFAFDPQEKVDVMLSGEKICEAIFVMENGKLYLEITATQGGSSMTSLGNTEEVLDEKKNESTE